ncbi:MAG: isopentenyl-diphosphate delta-isomerase [Bacteroidetes bacterium]|nr:isopentenyl-diphosphate delta-isomerase [Bacteroidota bacterium]
MTDRKKDHLDLAFQAQTQQPLQGLNYEPLFSGHPTEAGIPTLFQGKWLGAPLWISSMTGGTKEAAHINKNLAMVCAEFKLGMGLGSCRPLLESKQAWSDFDLRPMIGDNLPFFANLGIAQLEDYIDANRFDEINSMVSALKADGLIVHVNPLQEWMQPGGDRYKRPPIDTIRQVLDLSTFPIIVKEVGQGMGPRSLQALMELPLLAIEFGAFGGTNFALLELMRSENNTENQADPLAYIGHTADQMLSFAAQICSNPSIQVQTQHLIISGGIKSYLHGYRLVQQSPLPAVYAMASGFLAHARGDYAGLKAFVKAQLEGLSMARAVVDLP